jgi:hypothetical protein
MLQIHLFCKYATLQRLELVLLAAAWVGKGRKEVKELRYDFEG